jgi:hypothetical protein
MGGNGEAIHDAGKAIALEILFSCELDKLWHRFLGFLIRFFWRMRCDLCLPVLHPRDTLSGISPSGTYYTG